jgi:hypothetical protein
MQQNMNNYFRTEDLKAYKFCPIFCGLFYDAVSISEYIALNGKPIGG